MTATPPPPFGFTIAAYTCLDGTRNIKILRGKQSRKYADLLRRSPMDWQVAEANTIPELRRTIMLAFGMAWFNQARKQIKELEAGQ